MSSKSIPKEQLSAYQRWELSAFDQPGAGVKLPTADEIQRIQQQAYQEGFAAGMKDGRAEANPSRSRCKRSRRLNQPGSN